MQDLGQRPAVAKARPTKPLGEGRPGRPGVARAWGAAKGQPFALVMHDARALTTVQPAQRRLPTRGPPRQDSLGVEPAVRPPRPRGGVDKRPPRSAPPAGRQRAAAGHAGARAHLHEAGGTDQVGERREQRPPPGFCRVMLEGSGVAPMKRRATCHEFAQGKSGRPWAVAGARRKDRLGIERYKALAAIVALTDHRHELQLVHRPPRVLTWLRG